tara:strand:+ start:676 stop:1086 length:411 start_codon:yes stop_codon:yes gene_type:complete
MAINYDSKEDMAYLFKALRECCGLDAKTTFKVKDIYSAGSYDGIEIMASDKNGVTKPSQSDLEAKFETVKSRENFILLRKTRDSLLLESDWSQGGDVPDSLKTKWQTYRQTLRDLPANQTPSDWHLSNITWPTKPS